MAITITKQNPSKDKDSIRIIPVPESAFNEPDEKDIHETCGRILRTRKRKPEKDKKKVMAKEQSYER